MLRMRPASAWTCKACSGPATEDSRDGALHGPCPSWIQIQQYASLDLCAQVYAYAQRPAPAAAQQRGRLRLLPGVPLAPAGHGKASPFPAFPQVAPMRAVSSCLGFAWSVGQVCEFL